jgi:multidrug efflux pump subunit AcrA (membrane-fusion protein)
MEEAKIALEQSAYEPPATIRQFQMNLDKAKRAYQQALTNYDLKVIQAKATMREAKINLERAQKTKDEMDIALRNFDIMAPAPGMVIYSREHNGAKRTVGSEINTWDLVVAELPDLSSMVSRTYVNEIDISKIKKGQQVRIGVDAFPEKNYTGEVLTIANIGQQLPNADAKVFEVLIKIFERDTILRPSMTTSNKIITKMYDDVSFIPLEAIHSNDSIPYVFTKKGHRQVIVLGEPNENFVIIENGLDAGEEIYLSVPEEPEKFSWRGMELVQIIKQKEEEKARLIKEMNDSLKRNGNSSMRPQSNGLQGRGMRQGDQSSSERSSMQGDRSFSRPSRQDESPSSNNNR